MSVRQMNGNPGIWEKLSWGDMSDDEQEAWSALGWHEERWDNNDPPESADKEWSELSHKELMAANRLGFTERLWNETEDQ